IAAKKPVAVITRRDALNPMAVAAAQPATVTIRSLIPQDLAADRPLARPTADTKPTPWDGIGRSNARLLMRVGSPATHVGKALLAASSDESEEGPHEALGDPAGKLAILKKTHTQLLVPKQSLWRQGWQQAPPLEVQENVRPRVQLLARFNVEARILQ